MLRQLIAILPAFLPRQRPLFPTLVVLALIQVTLDSLYCSGIVLAASRAGNLLGRVEIRRRIECTLEVVLGGLGFELTLDLR